MSTTKLDPNAKFLTISEFKEALGKPSATINVVKNPKTEKLFMSVDAQSYRCQATIDSSKSMAVFVPSMDINGKVYKDMPERLLNACLINAENTDNVLFSL